LALSVDERRLVRDIIDAVVPGAAVSVFGSRSTGRARPYSDLDLLFTKPSRLSLAQQAELRQRFEASRLPYRVDLVEADALAPGMAERVRAECRRL
jgi:predicted nucleotidyltransferase